MQRRKNMKKSLSRWLGKLDFKSHRKTVEEAMKPLNDDDMENVSGGWNPWGPIFP